MLKLEIDKTASAKLLKLLDTAPAKFEKAVRIGLRRIGDEMKNRAARNAPYLSGNLRRSITMREMLHRVTIGTNLIYAPIHEFGGTIVPKRAKFLRFKIKGKWVMTKKVRIKKYKGRGYFKPAFDATARKAKRIMNEEIEYVIR